MANKISTLIVGNKNYIYVVMLILFKLSFHRQLHFQRKLLF